MRRGNLANKPLAFTLIEVLVAISIIAVLTILLIPNINRSLSKNNLAGDVQLVSSNIESARLLAGSTQKVELDNFGYYGLYIPPNGDKLAIIRVSADPNDPKSVPANASCDPKTLIVSGLDSYSTCVVDTINLSQGVSLVSTGTLNRFVLFRAPSQQVYFADNSSDPLVISNPPLASISQGIALQYGSKTATIYLNDATGQVSNVTYN